jgi:hypothetical protein
MPHHTTACASVLPVRNQQLIAPLDDPRVLIRRLSDPDVGDNVVQVNSAAMRRSQFITDAVEQIGTYLNRGAHLLHATGGPIALRSGYVRRWRGPS